MLKVIYVGFGGFIGSILRYSLYFLTSNILGYTTPVATLFVNIIGCFLIGCAYQLFSAHLVASENLRLFIMIGLLGGFTTFSAFSYEALDLLLSKKTFFSFLYILFSVVSCITAVYIGFNINKL